MEYEIDGGAGAYASMVAQILIQHGDTLYYPAVEEGVSLEWSRKGSPGKLKFTAVQDGVLQFQEGDPVKFSVDGKDMFYGFVFTKGKSSKSPYLWDVTVYDQLRYFKNKDTYNFVNKTADEILRMIAKDFQLRTGALESTGYKIASLVEDDASLFDMVQDALDETLLAKGKMYVLYDSVGALTLQNIESMKLDLLIDADTAGSYKYTGSIDSQTYNQIKITYKDENSGGRSVYIARDSAHINEWGLLQYTDTVEQPGSGAAKAEALLQLYNQKTKKLSLSDVLGDTRVRGGSSVICSLDLGDAAVQSYLMVEKVTHNFKNNQHTMDLNLRGGGFIA